MIEPETAEWLHVFLIGVATGGLLTSALAWLVSTPLWRWVQAPAPAKERGDDANRP